jgi:two-component system heavy metal sensor histidine kinase CusS
MRSRPKTEPVRWGTLRARLTAWNTAVVLVMALSTLMVVRVAARGMLYREADQALRSAVEEIVSAVREFHPDIAPVVADMRRMTASHRQRGWFMHLLTAQGETIWKSDNCPDAVATTPPSGVDRPESVASVGPYRWVRHQVKAPGRPTYHVRVGMHTGSLDQSVAGLLRLVLPVGAAVTLLTPLAGYWLAVRATRPVADMLRSAERLRPTRLSDRLPVRGTGDELDQLAVTVNGLLDQVANHVERQERFVADAAHELRGPLAAVRSSLEVAVAEDGASEDLRDALGDTLEATRHLSKVANDLLLLAETGGEPVPDGRAFCDLVAVASQSVAMFTGVATEQGIELSFSAPSHAPVGMDASWLHRVIGNLLDNAIRFTPSGGRVRVEVERHGDRPGSEVVFSVCDRGIGMTAEEAERAFERFFKADPAHSHSAGRRTGGLGLPICRSLVEASGGTIDLATRPGHGTTVTVRLPVREPGLPHGPGFSAEGQEARAMVQANGSSGQACFG